MPADILYPFIAQGAMVFIALLVLAHRRLKAYAAGETKGRYFKVFTGEGEPEHVRAAQRAYLNQFEMPMVFYAACLAAATFDKATIALTATAWVFVSLRLIHFVIHVTSNNVLWRFRVFMLANVALLAMWVQLAL